MTFALHQSGERTHSECPRTFYAQRFEGRKVEGFEPFERGTLVHKILENMLLTHAAGGDVNVAAIAELDRARAEAVISAAALDDAALLASRISDDWPKYMPPQGAKWVVEQPWALDERWNALSAPKGGPWPDEAAYAGTIDMAHWDDRGVVVWDYKSNWAPERAEDIVNDRQLNYYAGAAMKLFGVEEVVFKKAFVRYGHVPEVRVTWDDVVPTWNYMQARREQIAACLEATAESELYTDAAIENHFPRRVSYACGACPIWVKCEALHAAVEEGSHLEVHDGTDLERLAHWRQGFKAVAERLDKLARQAANDHGPLPLGDGTFLGHKPKNSAGLLQSYPETLAHLESLGMSDEQARKLYRFRGIGAVQDMVRELCPGKVERQAAMDELFGIKVKTEFGLIKPKKS